MKKIVASLIGLVVLCTVAFVFASPSKDYALEMQDKLEESNTLHEAARELGCKNYGQLMSDCFQKKPGACSKMHTAEQEYSLNFSADPRQECESDETTAEMEAETKEEVEAQPHETGYTKGVDTPVSDLSSSDPLFFDDEN